MNLKEEMLESAGIAKPRKSIERLITNGIYFNNNFEYDLKIAVEEGVITSNFANLLKNSINQDVIINKFFNTYAPMVEKTLENKINNLENELENSSVLEESENYIKELDDLRKKQEKIRNLTC